jgi:ABC-type transporter Mla maintaining outer membrane lipid asymmetry ATPase subunit MlaF
MLGKATTPAIEFRDIPYRVDQTQVLSSLSLQVARGEMLVLLGPQWLGQNLNPH